MKENSFDIKKNVLSKSNDNTDLLNTKEDSKVIKNEKTFQTNNNNLINFISNLNKFTFSSAFDYKGSKSFLKSKEKALDEILLDENIQNHKNDKKKIIKNNENEISPKKTKRKKKHNDVSRLSIKNKYQSKNEEEKEEISSKNKIIKNHSRKEKNKFKIWKNKNDEKIMKDIGLKMPKISSKFFSQIELKMFNDKNLNRIKPIKVQKPKYTHNNLKFPELNNNRNSSIKSDSSLIQLVNEINRV